VVVDGAVRDLPQFAGKGLPILARGTSPRAFYGTMRPWDVALDIQCGGVLVQPGDWIAADGDGVVVVPPDLAAGVLDDCEARRGDEAFSTALIAAGFPLADAYPLADHLRQFRARFLAEGVLPSSGEVAAARARP
jgi:regulator of RNase E activity RraA